MIYMIYMICMIYACMYTNNYARLSAVERDTQHGGAEVVCRAAPVLILSASGLGSRTLPAPQLLIQTA